MERYQKEFNRIIKLLKENPKGMTITEISQKLNINRNSVAKYLELLRVLGHVDMRTIGTAKVFYPSDRIPISSLLNQIHESIITIDENLKINFVNDMFLKSFNFTREDLIGKKINDINLFIFKDKDIQKTLLNSLDGSQVSIEKKFEPPISNKNYYFIINIIPIIYENIKKGLIIVIQDVTEKKLAELRLRESEKQYRMILDSLGDKIHLIDDKLRIIYYNPAFQNWVKELGLKEIKIGKTVYENFPFLPKNVKDEYTYVFKTAKPLTTVNEIKINNKTIFTEVRKLPIIQEGKVVHILTIVRDITLRKELELKLNEIKELKNYLIDKSAIGICIIQNKKIVYVNERTLNIFGYNKKDMTNFNLKNLINLIHSYNKEKIKEIFENIKIFDRIEKPFIRIYFYIITKSGKTILIYAYIKRIKYKNQPAILLFLIDLTDILENLAEIIKNSDNIFKKFLEFNNIGKSTHIDV